MNTTLHLIFIDDIDHLHVQYRDDKKEFFYHMEVIDLNAPIGQGIQIC